MFDPADIVYPFSAGFVVTVAACVLILLTRRWHGRHTNDDTTGPQKFHGTPVPRIGGLAVFAGYWAAAAAAPEAVRGLMAAVGLAGAAALIAGVREDLTDDGGVAVRLVATMLSGAAFILLTGYAIDRVDIAFIDRLLAFPVLAAAVAVLAMAGLAHAINIIDGFHGLATGSVIIMLMAFAGVALKAGDGEMAVFCFIAAGVMLGFLLVNFPGGHVFLGDGGAYFAGFVLAAAAIMIPMRNPGLCPWIAPAVLAYPLLEVAFSVARRLGRDRKSYQADGLHLHMLVYRRYGRRLARAAGNERLANPATGLFMWAGPMASVGLAAAVPNDREWLIAVLATMAALYALAYRNAVGPRPN